jgi:hypothetical protein
MELITCHFVAYYCQPELLIAHITAHLFPPKVQTLNRAAVAAAMGHAAAWKWTRWVGGRKLSDRSGGP